MTTPGPVRSAEDFRSTVDQFAFAVPGVRDVVVASTDGLQIVASSGVDRDLGDQTASLMASLLATASSAGSLLEGATAQYVSIRLDGGVTVLLTRIGDEAGMVVTTEPDADLRQVVQSLVEFSARYVHLLTPELRGELQRRTAVGLVADRTTGPTTGETTGATAGLTGGATAGPAGGGR